MRLRVGSAAVLYALGGLFERLYASEKTIMSFFISDAWAQAAPGQQDLLTGMLPLVFIFVVFYFLLIRPQSKKAKEHKALIGALAKGDEVVTNGGLLGRITNVGDTFIELEVGEGMKVKVQRQAISSLMPKGTVKES
jgi:preprotein translocase subunit YajC